MPLRPFLDALEPFGQSAVSSRPAYEALREAWRLAPRLPLRRGLDYLFGLDPAVYAYRDWLRRKLASSGIAQRLPGGLELFPDIHAGLHPTLRYLLSFLRPRTRRQLVRHLVEQLPFYLDQRRPGAGLRYLAGLFLVLAAGMLIFSACAFGGDWASIGNYIAACCLALALMCFGFVYSGVGSIELEGLWPRIHAAEFYYYLRESYSDPADADELFSAELAADSRRAELRALRPLRRSTPL